MSPAPVPSLARRILERVLPAEARRDVLGDLEESFRSVRRARGRLRAWLWYWRQACAFLMRIPGARLGRGGSPPHYESSMTRNFLTDLRYGVRSLCATPGLSLVVVCTMALAIGANTAIFSVVNSVLLRPLAFTEPERLVRIYQFYSSTGEVGGTPSGYDVVSPLDYVDYRDQRDIFSALVGYGNYRPTGFDLTGQGSAVRVVSAPVTADYFEVYDVRPALGRAFDREQEDGLARVVVLSHALWQQLFEADPEILGRTVMLNGESWEVIGVMPEGFVDVVHGGLDVWVPHDMTEGGFNSRDNHYMTVVGRLAQGVSFEEAGTRLAAFDARLRELYPDSNATRHSLMLPLHEDRIGEADTLLWLLLGATGLVLLIGCVNVANLLIGCALARRKELAIRTALGSGRARLVQQLFTESLVLALAGGVLGLVLAMFTTRLLVALAPVELTQINNIVFDARVLAFALAVALVTAVLFGVGPALRGVGGALETSLRDGDRGNTGGQGTRRVRAALVVSEVALALVLLVGAGLLLKTFHSLQTRDLGITPSQVATFELELPANRYASAEERRGFYNRLHARLRAIPGVASTAAVQWLPATGDYNIWGFGVPDADDDDGWRVRSANIRVIDGEYLDTVGLRLLRGRPFRASDEFGGPWVVYLNEAAVRAGWPDGGDPLGATVRVGGNECEVVGIVADTFITPRSAAPAPKVYFSHEQFSDRHWSLFQLVRVEDAVPGLMDLVRAEIASIDPDLVAYNARSLEGAIGNQIADTRFAMVLLVGFAILAALLAAVGTYGVLSYAVGQRVHEIGIRMALGAGARGVQGMVLRQGLAFALLGGVLGMVVAAFATRLMRSLLFGVTATDPLVFLSVAALVVAIAGIAAWIPARRATRVDPVRVLR